MQKGTEDEDDEDNVDNVDENYNDSHYDDH